MKKTTLLLLAFHFTFFLFSQTKITGKVSDETAVLPGANIIIKGTKTGTATNLDGIFELEVTKNDTLSISYLGYTTQEIIINNQKAIAVVLEVANTIDEVVLIGLTSKRIDCLLTCFSLGCGGNSCEVTALELKESAPVNPIALYPNPSSSGYFNLKLLDNHRKIEIQVAHISGQIIQSNTFEYVSDIIRLDLSKFASGIYIINILADGKKLPAKKAIIQ